MTMQAIGAIERLEAQLMELADSLTDAEWIAPSACAGWRTRDVYAHLAIGARSLIDPLPVPDERLPLPENREREHDVHVDMRRGWTNDEVLAEFKEFAPQRFERFVMFQDESMAATEIELPGLGKYELHQGANAMAFDYFCHLHHDLLRPAGMIDRPRPSFTHDDLYPTVQWMMWGLPQMQGPELDDSVTAPITLQLTGEGESTWTVSKNGEGTLDVAEEGGGDVTVTSSAYDFVAWGTGRTPWFQSCTIDGDAQLARPFLSTLDII